MSQQAETLSREIREHIFNYLKSDGPGGKHVIGAFLEEFELLADRSPKDDPTNLKNYLSFLVQHMKQTWDESLSISEDGEIEVGICTDETLGFSGDMSKLKHNPPPTIWVVFLIRGIAGRYAFVNPATYYLKKGQPMPAQYFGGFLISKRAWDREGWGVVGSFEQFEHPASGATPIPFGENVIKRIDMQKLVGDAIKDYQTSRSDE
jgi:hypothetical protein